MTFENISFFHDKEILISLCNKDPSAQILFLENSITSGCVFVNISIIYKVSHIDIFLFSIKSLNFISSELVQCPLYSSSCLIPMGKSSVRYFIHSILTLQNNFLHFQFSRCCCESKWSESGRASWWWSCVEIFKDWRCWIDCDLFAIVQHNICQFNIFSDWFWVFWCKSSTHLSTWFVIEIWDYFFLSIKSSFRTSKDEFDIYWN